MNEDPKLMCINVKDETDIKKSDLIKKNFPDLSSKMKYSEKGVELFAKITGDINEHNRQDASKLEQLFKSKVPYVTYFLIAVNVILYIVPLILGQYQEVLNMWCVHGPSIRAGQYYRLITGAFLHGSIWHIFFNCYALKIIGSQIESFMGKTKFLIIYFYSAIMGSLLSMTFAGDGASIGASGAIFGLMGALIYFGYYYRVYLGNVLKSQIIPIVIFNLVLGFILPGVDNFGHIGGLIGGILISRALGVKDKTTTFEKGNGWIMALIFTIFIVYVAFVYSA